MQMRREMRYLTAQNDLLLKRTAMMEGYMKHVLDLLCARQGQHKDFSHAPSVSEATPSELPALFQMQRQQPEAAKDHLQNGVVLQEDKSPFSTSPDDSRAPSLDRQPAVSEKAVEQQQQQPSGQPQEEMGHLQEESPPETLTNGDVAPPETDMSPVSQTAITPGAQTATSDVPPADTSGVPRAEAYIPDEPYSFALQGVYISRAPTLSVPLPLLAAPVAAHMMRPSLAPGASASHSGPAPAAGPAEGIPQSTALVAPHINLLAAEAFQAGSSRAEERSPPVEGLAAHPEGVPRKLEPVGWPTSMHEFAFGEAGNAHLMPWISKAREGKTLATLKDNMNLPASKLPTSIVGIWQVSLGYLSIFFSSSIFRRKKKDGLDGGSEAVKQRFHLSQPFVLAPDHPTGVLGFLGDFFLRNFVSESILFLLLLPPLLSQTRSSNLPPLWGSVSSLLCKAVLG
jgi:hypothetical protein